MEVTPAATVLEAALLETDEIKRLHPPYNVQLREGDRRVWFARADLDGRRAGARRRPPRRSAALALGAGLAGRHPRARQRRRPVGRARAGGGGGRAAPLRARSEALFLRAWDAFRALHLGAGAEERLARPAAGLAAAGAHRRGRRRRRGRPPPTGGTSIASAATSTAALLRGGQLVRRARWLVLLSDASVAFREPGGERLPPAGARRGGRSSSAGPRRPAGACPDAGASPPLAPAPGRASTPPATIACACSRPSWPASAPKAARSWCASAIG